MSTVESAASLFGPAGSSADDPFASIGQSKEAEADAPQNADDDFFANAAPLNDSDFVDSGVGEQAVEQNVERPPPTTTSLPEPAAPAPNDGRHTYAPTNSYVPQTTAAGNAQGVGWQGGYGTQTYGAGSPGMILCSCYTVTM